MIISSIGGRRCGSGSGCGRPNGDRLRCCRRPNGRTPLLLFILFLAHQLLFMVLRHLSVTHSRRITTKVLQ